ncbi:amino acid adenylation domain-containing protein [Kribbella sp. NPDC051587]|uniref:amino acid adenylation domain-containing protein n=1 Tax=Kribbella sp. NPDC051587 TaxID=3364119 RepID=UPI0037AFF318
MVRSGADRPAISTGPALMIPAGYPRDLPSALLRAARDFSGAGVVEIGADGRETKLDFPTLLELAARILAGLRANGVRAGDPAVVHCTEPVGFFAAFWACTLGGIRPLLMAPSPEGDRTEAGRERLRTVTDLLGWTVLIGRPSDLPDDLGLPVLDPDALAGHEPTNEFHRPAADDVAVLMLSSGTTGTPKIVQLTHRGLVEFAAGTPAMLPVRPGQTTLNWLPLDQSGAFLLYHLLPVFTGCTNIHVNTNWVLADPLRWLDLMDQHRVNHSWSPNFGYRVTTQAIAGEPDRHWDLSALRSLVSGGEQITVPVMTEFLRLTNRFGVVPETFVAAWGMTETVTGITFARPGLTPNVHRVRVPPTGIVEWVDQRPSSGKVAVARPGKTRAEAPGVLSLVSVGAPAPGTTVRIVAPNGAVLPEGRIGQLQVASARVTPGYLGNLEADREAFPVGNWPMRKWLSTGDQGFITGGQVVITGRDSERIIMRGTLYYAHDIEAVAAAVVGAEAGLVAACAVPDVESGTDRLVVFYALTPDSIPGMDQAIRSLIQTRLQLVAEVVGVPRRDFPTTPGGKILRPLLKQRWLDGTLETPPHPYVEPAGATSYSGPTGEGPESATANTHISAEELEAGERTTELPTVRLAWQRTLQQIPTPPQRPTLGTPTDPLTAPASALPSDASPPADAPAPAEPLATAADDQLPASEPFTSPDAPAPAEPVSSTPDGLPSATDPAAEAATPSGPQAPADPVSTAADEQLPASELLTSTDAAAPAELVPTAADGLPPATEPEALATGDAQAPGEPVQGHSDALAADSPTASEPADVPSAGDALTEPVSAPEAAPVDASTDSAEPQSASAGDVPGNTPAEVASAPVDETAPKTPAEPIDGEATTADSAPDDTSAEVDSAPADDTAPTESSGLVDGAVPATDSDAPTVGDAPADVVAVSAVSQPDAPEASGESAPACAEAVTAPAEPTTPIDVPEAEAAPQADLSETPAASADVEEAPTSVEEPEAPTASADVQETPATSPQADDAEASAESAPVDVQETPAADVQEAPAASTLADDEGAPAASAPDEDVQESDAQVDAPASSDSADGQSGESAEVPTEDESTDAVARTTELPEAVDSSAHPVADEPADERSLVAESGVEVAEGSPERADASPESAEQVAGTSAESAERDSESSPASGEQVSDASLESGEQIPDAAPQSGEQVPDALPESAEDLPGTSAESAELESESVDGLSEQRAADLQRADEAVGERASGHGSIEPETESSDEPVDVSASAQAEQLPAGEPDPAAEVESVEPAEGEATESVEAEEPETAAVGAEGLDSSSVEPSAEEPESVTVGAEGLDSSSVEPSAEESSASQEPGAVEADAPEVAEPAAQVEVPAPDAPEVDVESSAAELQSSAAPVADPAHRMAQAPTARQLPTSKPSTRDEAAAPELVIDQPVEAELNASAERPVEAEVVTDDLAEAAEPELADEPDDAQDPAASDATEELVKAADAEPDSAENVAAPVGDSPESATEAGVLAAATQPAVEPVVVPEPAQLAAEAAVVPAATQPAAEAAVVQTPAQPAAALVEPVAVVGVAGRFPGAETLEQFWDNLVGGVESVRRFATDESGELAVSGVLEHVESFDAKFFGLSDREAELMDPAQRLFLEVCHQALEHAGYGGVTNRVGVFAGSGMNLYNRQPQARDSLAARVAYRLGLTGPAIGVQSAWSSSLVAVHLACQALRSGDADLALAGASAVQVPQATSYQPSSESILSPSGHVRAFDAAADGTVGGNGVAAVLLKRLDQAVADGDTVYAVIRGTAVSSDDVASSNQTLIERALERAGFAAESLSYLEANAIGSVTADAVEVQALTTAIRRHTDKVGFCTIGSVKPNIGHLDSASGMAGLIKTILMLQHRTLVPTINYTEPNPALALGSSPFVVATEARDWEAGTTLRAGVSALDAGGTNAHVILEEPPRQVRRGDDGPVVLPLSAPDPDALTDLVELYRADLEQGTGHRLIDLAGTAALGRPAHRHRIAVAGASEAELVDALGSAQATEIPRGGPGPLGYAFTGQGAARRGMAAGLAARFPVFRSVLDECDRVYAEETGGSLLDLLLTPAGQSEGVWPTETAQPALFAFELALARLWQSFGVQPALVVGHSVGEYAALCVAEALSLADGVRLTAKRGELMQRGTAPGAMVSVRADADRVRELAQTSGVEIAAGNGPQSFVLTGSEVIVGQLAEQLDQLQVAWQRLDVDRAFHSSLVDPILADFATIVRGITLKPLRTPMVSSWSGELLESGTVLDGDYLVGQLRQPVLFGDAVEAVTAAGCRRFLELGPDAVLSPAGRRIAPNSTWIPAQRLGQDPVLATMNGLAELYEQGTEITWSKVYGYGGRVPLPTYPFRRVHHPVDTSSAAPAAVADGVVRGSVSAFERAARAQAVGFAPSSAAVKRIPLDPPAEVAEVAAVDDNAEEESPFALPEETHSVDADYLAQAGSLSGDEVSAERYRESLDAVLDLTCDVLRLDPYDLTVDHTFAELGGTAESMAPVIDRINEQFSVELTAETLFSSYTTPHKLATAVAVQTTRADDEQVAESNEPAEAPVVEEETVEPVEIAVSEVEATPVEAESSEPVGEPDARVALAVLGTGLAELAARVEEAATATSAAELPGSGMAALMSQQLRVAGQLVDGVTKLMREQLSLLSDTTSSTPEPAETGYDAAVPAAPFAGGTFGPETPGTTQTSAENEPAGDGDEAADVAGASAADDGAEADPIDADGRDDSGAAAERPDAGARDDSAGGERSVVPVLYSDGRVGELRRVVVEGEMAPAVGGRRRDVGYWQVALAGAEPLVLPADGGRRGEVASVKLELEDELGDAVFVFSRERKVSPLMTMLAAVGTVLGRFAAQEDVTIGSALIRPQGDTSAGVRRALPIRIDLSGEPDLGELAHRVRDVTTGAFDHAGTDLAILQRDPLFQILVEFEDGEEELPEPLDLRLRLTHHGAGITCTADYRAGLFHRSTIDRLLNYLQAVLRRATAEPRLRLPQLMMPIAADLEALRRLEGDLEPVGPIGRGRRDAVVAGELSGLHTLFEQQVARTPDAVALVQGQRELTYTELDRRSNAVAWQLTDLGVKPGQLVAVRVARGTELVVAVLGVLKSGAAYLPLDPGVPESRWAFMVNDAAAVALVGDDAALADRLGLRLVPVATSDSDPRSRQAPPVQAAADDLAYCIYTSGSNGNPKGVLVPHRGPVNLVRHYLRTRSSLRTLQWTSFGFDVHVQEMFTALASGSALVLIGEDDRYDPDAVISALRDHGVERLFMAFSPLTALLATMRRLPELPALREIVAGGEAMVLTHKVRDFLDAHPECRLYNEYGPVEASIVTTIHAVDPTEDRPSIGRPVDGVAVRLLDQVGRPVPVGGVGEIHLGGAAVAQGYIGRPDETETAFVPDPAHPGGRLYRSRDLGRWRPDGTLEYLGRADDQVKIRGHRVEPGETEHVLADQPGVIDAVVIAISDHGGDTCLIGYVVLEDSDPATLARLMLDLGKELPIYLVPADLIPIEELPLDDNGRLDRTRLPEPEWLHP